MALRTSGPISADGLTNIANYKYVPGSYTPLDLILNPLWTKCTEYLPMWMAPNMVTSIGGLHVLALVSFHTYFSPNFAETVPGWVLCVNGLLLAIYYWLDCMDGKQARRTGSSSPLGQLFDHGVDCLCIMGQFLLIAEVCAPHCRNQRWILGGLALTQTGFFLAQLVEYYYHFIPHALGGVIGTTEINLGLAFGSVALSVVDQSIFAQMIDLPFIGATSVGEVNIYASCALLICAIFVPLITITQPEDRVGVWSAACMMFVITLHTVFVWPQAIVDSDPRLISIATWLVSSYVTIQVIVFSLAKQEFSRVQWPVCLYCFSALAARFFVIESTRGMLVVLCVVLCVVLLEWVRAAIGQITEKLEIQCFRLRLKNA